MSVAPKTLVTTISCLDSYKRALLLWVPIMLLNLIGYFFLPLVNRNSEQYTNYLIITFVLAAYALARKNYLVINVFTNSIEVVYPLRLFNKRHHFAFNTIEMIDIKTTEEIITVFLITRAEGKHFYHIMQEKQHQELSKALDEVATFKLLNKVKY
jgi:hypothetical protein